MNSLDRFRSTVARKPVDRPCTWLGIPDVAAIEGLFRYFGVGDLPGLVERLDDDIVPVELPYRSPTANAIHAAFDFARKGKVSREERTLNAEGFFAGRTNPKDVELFDWPDPARYISPDECRQAVDGIPPGRVCLGVIWSAHFQDACAAFGMEQALMALHETPAVFRAVIDRIVDFYLKANEIFYAATAGRLHAILIGNDFGAQEGLILSPAMIRKFAFPGTRRLVEQAKRHGLTVMHHSCGAVREIIPDLIEIGVDIIHPIQALARGMQPESLQCEFGDRVAFCGGVDAQHLLVRGTPRQVSDKVRELRRIFPTGLIVSPSHEAILPDIPPANIEAMFTAAHAGMGKEQPRKGNQEMSQKSIRTDMTRKSADTAKAEAAPTAAQLGEEFLRWRFGMFLHFGPATFHEREWACGYEDPSAFAPDKLDCGQWADAASAAGMKYAVLTSKHTCGWCLWKGRHTAHDMKAFLNYKNGKGDIVREFTDTFRARGMKVGLYYCFPGDFSAKTLPPGKPDLHGLPPEAKNDYAGFIKKQFTELLTQYGPIDLLWIDQYISKYAGDWKSFKAHAKSIQPNCIVIANNSRNSAETDIHGFEYPYHMQVAPERALPSEDNKTPSEVCDKIGPGWFWSRQENTENLKTVEEITAMLKLCNSRRANYLLNVAPDTTGLIPEASVARLRKVGAAGG